MRLVTTWELEAQDERQLSALFKSVSERLVHTRRDTAERRNALATLENINRQRAVRNALTL